MRIGSEIRTIKKEEVFGNEKTPQGDKVDNNRKGEDTLLFSGVPCMKLLFLPPWNP